MQQGSQVQPQKESFSGLEASGYMQIKRKMFWVIRYGEIINGYFYYYYNKGDSDPRNVYQLAGSSVTELSSPSDRMKDDYIIQFIANQQQQQQKILLRFDNQSEHRLWLNRLLAGVAQQQQVQNASFQQNQYLNQSNSQQYLLQPLGQSQQLMNQQQVSNQKAEKTNSSANSNNNSNPQQLFVSASEKQLSLQVNKNNNSSNNNSTDLPSDNSQTQLKTQKQFQQQQQQQQLQSKNNNSSRFSPLPMQQLEIKRDSDQTMMQRKSKTFVLDGEFLTAERAPTSLLSLKKNLQIAFETCFNECNNLCDVSKDVKLYCSDAALKVQYDNKTDTTKATDQNSLNSSTSSLDSQSGRAFNELKNYFGQYLSELFESNQMKVAAGLCVLLLALIIYQCLKFLDNTSVMLSMIILINMISLPFLSKIFADSLKTTKKKRKSKQNGKHLQKKHGLRAEIYFNHTLNEFLFGLTRCCENRSEWQLGVIKSEKKSADLIQITYKSNETEMVSQNVFRDGSTLYVTEQHATNHSFIRIFSIPLNTISERGFLLNYYFYSNALKISDASTSDNSPALVRGLQLYLDGLKRSPTSSIFAYQRSLLDHQSGTFEQSAVLTQNANKSQKNEKIEKPTTQEHISSQKYPQIVVKKELPTLHQEEEQKEEEEKKEENPPSNKSHERDSLKNQSPEEEISMVLQPEKPQNSYFLTGEAGELYNQKLEDALQLLTKVIPLSPENNWKEGNCNQDLLRHSKIDEKSGNVMSRGESTIKRSAEKVLEFLKDRTKRSQWDESFKEGRRVEEFTLNASIEYNIFKGMLTVSDRDMVLFQSNFELNGKFYLIAFSVPYAKIPENKKPVRATLIIAGWIITPKSDNECQCIYITCADLNGSIGKTIKDMVAKQQGGGVLKVKNAIEKK